MLPTGRRPAPANHLVGALVTSGVDDRSNQIDVVTRDGRSPFQTGKPNHRPVQQPHDFGVGVTWFQLSARGCWRIKQTSKDSATESLEPRPPITLEASLKRWL